MNTRNKAIGAILSKFTNVKETANGWQACCPAHDDNNPSLSISVAGQKVLIKCFAECETVDVLAAAGLDWADLHLGGDRPRVVAKI
jgi:putative DNA primase/helicase